MESKLIHELLSLSHLVSDIRSFEAYTFNSEARSHKFFADGLVGLMFYVSDSKVLFNEKEPSKLLLYGQTVKPLEIVYTTNFSSVIFYFQPYAIKYLFGIDARQLTDTCIDFDIIDKKLRLDLINTDQTEERIKIVAHYLLRAEQTVTKQPDRRITYATDRIQRESGNISLLDLRKQIHITERTFERQFLHHVGVTPGTFSKICRFNNALKQLHRRNFSNLTDLAYSTGYADQSHFIHHFKEFTSMTPTQYISQLPLSNSLSYAGA